MTMTLEQVRDWHLARDREQRAVGLFIGATDHAGIAAAIDAHLTQPAQSVDVEKVREVIAHLRSFRSNTPPTWAHLDDAADKLEAAIKGVA